MDVDRLLVVLLRLHSQFLILGGEVENRIFNRAAAEQKRGRSSAMQRFAVARRYSTEAGEVMDNDHTEFEVGDEVRPRPGLRQVRGNPGGEIGVVTWIESAPRRRGKRTMCIAFPNREVTALCADFLLVAA